jgi:hypothetical protein
MDATQQIADCPGIQSASACPRDTSRIERSRNSAMTGDAARLDLPDDRQYIARERIGSSHIRCPFGSPPAVPSHTASHNMHVGFALPQSPTQKPPPGGDPRPPPFAPSASTATSGGWSATVMLVRYHCDLGH